jgi:hypothetical protein
VTDLLFEMYDETKLANDALASHLSALEVGSPVSGPHPLRLLLPEVCRTSEVRPLEFGMRAVRRAIRPLTIEMLNRFAASCNVTLNSVLLGTLATQLRTRSGQDQLVINQTYLGRRPDQLRAVGSYSRAVAMEFTFDDESSLVPTCQYVFAETMRTMVAPVRELANATLFSNVSYELNDLRPLPRPSSYQHFNVVLCDLFFHVNQYADGLDAVVLYDVSKFEDADAKLILEYWLLGWKGLDGLGALEDPVS